MEADQLGRVRDILQAARLIASYLKDTTEADLLANSEKQDAVIRRIEIIGEATAHLTEATRQAIPELPFRKMRSMRNIVAHDYASEPSNLHPISARTQMATRTSRRVSAAETLRYQLPQRRRTRARYQPLKAFFSFA
jgi:uncharacterized protein with HEPN domain